MSGNGFEGFEGLKKKGNKGAGSASEVVEGRGAIVEKTN